MADQLPNVPELLQTAVRSLGGAERTSQLTMASAVAHSIDTGEHLAVQAGTGTGIMPGWNALNEVYLDEFGDTPALDRPKMLALIITDGEAQDTDAFAAEMAKVGKSAYIAICIMGFGDEHDRALSVYQKVAEANDHVRVVSFGNSSDPNRIADAVISMVG